MRQPNAQASVQRIIKVLDVSTQRKRRVFFLAWSKINAVQSGFSLLAAIQSIMTSQVLLEVGKDVIIACQIPQGEADKQKGIWQGSGKETDLSSSSYACHLRLCFVPVTYCQAVGRHQVCHAGGNLTGVYRTSTAVCIFSMFWNGVTRNGKASMPSEEEMASKRDYNLSEALGAAFCITSSAFPSLCQMGRGKKKNTITG